MRPITGHSTRFSKPMLSLLSLPPAAPDRTRKKLQSKDVAAVSRPPCFEPNSSKAEDFGLETEPTPTNRSNQMKFQVSPAPRKHWPHSRTKLPSVLATNIES